MAPEVVIITRDRLPSLQRLLKTLCSQSRLVSSVLIVDSSKDFKSVYRIIHQFSHKLSIRVKRVPPLGFGLARNVGLQFAKTNWLIFVDDDCVVPNNWYEMATQALVLNKNQAIAIMGRTKNLHPTNLFSCMFQQSNSWWVAANLQPDNWLNFCAVDHRNLLLNKKAIKQLSLQYNSSLSTGGEDIDFAHKLVKAGQKIKYFPKLTVYHEWPNDLISYLSRKYNYKKTNIKMSSKMRLVTEKPLTNSQKNVINKEIQQLSVFNKILLKFFTRLENVFTL